MKDSPISTPPVVSPTSNTKERRQHGKTAHKNCSAENSVPQKAHIATVKVRYTDKVEPEKTALASVKVGYTDKVEPKKTKLWTITKKLG